VVISFSHSFIISDDDDDDDDEDEDDGDDDDDGNTWFHSFTVNNDLSYQY